MAATASHQLSSGRCMLTKLPEELLDEICSVAFKEDGGTATSLIALSLTSRAFLEPARRTLYRKPHAVTALRDDLRRHTRFIGSLRDNPESLRYIRDLTALGESVGNFFEEERGEIDPQTIQYELVARCPNLRRVCVFLSDNFGAGALAASLAAPHRPRLDLVGLVVFKPEQHAVCKSFCQQFLRVRPDGASALDVVVWEEQVGLASADAGLPALAPRLHLHFWCSLELGSSFLPVEMDHLVSLKLYLYDSEERHPDSTTLTALLSRLSSAHRLRHFHYDGPILVANAVGLQQYQSQTAGAYIPAAALARLPSTITRLTFARLRLFSTEHLAVLSIACPSLVQLDLSGTLWAAYTAEDFRRTTDHHHRHRLCPSPSPSSAEQQLIGVLSRFPRLERVHLGILPVEENRHCLCGIRAHCTERGTRLKYHYYVEDPNDSDLGTEPFSDVSSDGGWSD
ncbi:hypothetical protein JCM10213_003511 [Rhodosporidiobolus nylandii]